MKDHTMKNLLLKNLTVPRAVLGAVGVLGLALIAGCGSQGSSEEHGRLQLGDSTGKLSVRIDPVQYNFGDVTVYTPKFMTATITNYGSVQASLRLSTDMIEDGPGFAPPHSRTEITESTCPRELGAQQSCTATVKFMPDYLTPFK